MKRVQTNLTILQRLWEDSLAIEVIAEPLASVPATANAADVAQQMAAHNWDAIGLCQDDSASTSAYLNRQDLKDGPCGQYAQQFDIQDLVSSYSPIYQSLQRLCERKRLFVLGRKGVEGIVTVADLQKQPVRLMLFAAVSLLEMAMLAKIRLSFTDGRWFTMLKSERADAALSLHTKRLNKGQDIDLADCLQLCDKATILLKNSDLGAWGFASKSKANHFFGRVQTLRDNLAHAQDPSEGTDWPEVCAMFARVQELTRQLANPAEPNAGEGPT